MTKFRLTWVLAVLWGCIGPEADLPQIGMADASSFADAGAPDAPCGTLVEESLLVPAMVPTDLLIIVSTAPSMANVQEGFHDNIRAMARYQPSLHYSLKVGVTTADPSLAAGGLLPLGGSDSQRFLHEDDLDFTARWQAKLRLGTSGHSEAAPLESLRLALEGFEPGGINEGFRRQDALLWIVIITASDDTSPLPLGVYEDALRQEPKPFLYLDTVSGGRDGCASASATVVGSPRLATFIDEFNGPSLTPRICRPDWSRGLERISQYPLPTNSVDLAFEPVADSITVEVDGQDVPVGGPYYPPQRPFRWTYNTIFNRLDFFQFENAPEPTQFIVRYETEACR